MFWEGGWECARLIGSYDTLGQTPHSCWPEAAPCRTVSDRVGTVLAPCRTVPCQAGTCHRVSLTLAHPCFNDEG